MTPFKVRRITTIVVLALTLASLGAPSAEAAGEGSALLRGAPPPNQGNHQAVDVAADSAGRIFFASLVRQAIPVGSSADQLCTAPRDGRGCGRIGRINPGGSIAYFGHEFMRRPIAVATRGRTAFVADSGSHSIFRVRDGARNATEIVLLSNHRAFIPTDLIVRGDTVWFLATDYTGRENHDRAERIGRVGRFNVNNPGAVQSWRVPGLRDLAGLTFDAAGRLWFTGNGQRVRRNGQSVELGIGFGRLNLQPGGTGGSVQVFRQTDFGATTFPSNPSEMITGPDGRIWFVDNGTSQIGRFAPADPTGTFEKFGAICDGLGPQASCGGRLFDLATGPDGAVWYTRSRADQVGRIDVAGQMSTVSPAIQGFDQPYAIARQGQRLIISLPATFRVGWFVPD